MLLTRMTLRTHYSMKICAAFIELNLFALVNCPMMSQRKCDIHDVFDNYSAYSYHGRGNSFTPNRVTIRVRSHNNADAKRYGRYKIGYIGTDTTEFLFYDSMVRKLGTINRVSAINAWYTNEWDAEFIDWLKDDHPLICHQKVRHYEISPELIKQSETCDIIVSTYVSPWAGLYDKLYQELLSNLMSESSFLLSVDPQSAEKSVRLPLTGEINNQILYGNILSLILAKTPVTKKI